MVICFGSITGGGLTGGNNGMLMTSGGAAGAGSGAGAGGGGGAGAGRYGWGFAGRFGATGTRAAGGTSRFAPADSVAGRGGVLVEDGSDSDLAGAVEVAASATNGISVVGDAVVGVEVSPAWLVAW